MKILSTKAHGLLDYIMGLMLISAPWIFGFADYGPETWVPQVIGGSLLVYSLCTNYELGLIKVLPMNLHLILDIVAGILLATSPWLFGFSNLVFLPHLIFGVLEVGAAIATKTSPQFNGPIQPKYD